MGNLRVGAVSYLNTKPLVFGLEAEGHAVDLIYDLPSCLADRLAKRELDVALIPVIEAITNPDYAVVSDACIACRGPVRSVKLFSHVPWEEIKSVALDEGSRTSAALARIILKQRYSVEPEYTKLPIHQPWRDSKSDAVLVIGDRAMTSIDESGQPDQKFRFSCDLGDYWFRWTELPFVFAVWAARRGVNCDYLDSILSHARDAGIQNVEAICRTASSGYDMTESSCRQYLTEHLHYRLGRRERMGLELFLEYAERQSIIHPDLTLHFHDCQTTG